MTEYIQRDAIVAITSLLESEGHRVPYTDRPGSNRGGTGDHGKVNTILEQEFDRFPDIVSITPENEVLFVEVDRQFDETFVDKFYEYKESSVSFLSSMRNRIDEEIKPKQNNLRFGFGTYLTSMPRVDIQYDEFYTFRMKEQTGEAARITGKYRSFSDFVN